MYATSSEHTRVPWAAHSYNVAFSDEIGHFEYCTTIPVEGGRLRRSESRSTTTTTCFSPAVSLLVQIGGCIATDTDFDGIELPARLAGDGPEPGPGHEVPRRPSVVFTSPLFNGTRELRRVAFEADLPRIEAADFGGICNRSTGENCVNPPQGATFYPIFTTANSRALATLSPDAAAGTTTASGTSVERI